MSESLRGLRVRLEAALPGSSQRRLSSWTLLLARIAAEESRLTKLGDYELRKASLSLRYRAKSGEPLVRLLPEAFALVREAARRTINLLHFDSQLLGGIAMFHGAIVEMQTGEGKTLAATLPLCLYAMAGKGCHLATSNDYLARRDAEWMGPIYQALGLSVGVLQARMPRAQRRQAYACDVTYGTAAEFGFDFLRDRLVLRRLREEQADLLGLLLRRDNDSVRDEPMQRSSYFALVDEADSVLIDSARTPLVIAVGHTKQDRLTAACARWSAEVVGELVEHVHYKFRDESRIVDLTRAGRRKIRLLAKPDLLAQVPMFDIYRYMEFAIRAERDFLIDQQYVVRDGRIVIVNEFSGRPIEGHKWSSGIHAAVEAKEGLKITTGTGGAARVTIQDFFRRYRHLAGMTGTASEAARELRRVYECSVIVIPTNRPTNRTRWPTVILGTQTAKWAAVVDEVARLHEEGRPVLIGTRSVKTSDHLSRLLDDKGIAHRVLNARHLAAEADIVANAGFRGMVTVATNMAGRGTDIRLGPGVAALGGLHVICTEMHDSARIDRQLIGRCGRQGDPGTFRQFLALDDELLRIGLGQNNAKEYETLGRGSAGPLDHFLSVFCRAQKAVEQRHFRDRCALLHREEYRKKLHDALGQDPYLDSPG